VITKPNTPKADTVVITKELLSDSYEEQARQQTPKQALNQAAKDCVVEA